MRTNIPFFSTRYQDERYGNQLRASIDEVVTSGSFILGPRVARFEQRLAAYCGVKHAIGVANGSDALYLVVKALGLPAGSEVITSPYTFFASAACLVRNGLVPVFVDVQPDTFHIDVEACRRKVTPRTRAILPVDLFSHTVDTDAFAAFAHEHGLAFLEDSAEAFGMRWNGKHAGSAATAGVLSFFPTKTLGAFGDAGAILTNDDELARYCRVGRVHGAAKKYHHDFVGINSRLDEIQAAILDVKLDHVDSEIAERAAIAAAYDAALEGVPGVRLPRIPKNASPVWYVYAPIFERRDALAAHLSDHGIGSSVYWPKPLHIQECFAGLGHTRGDFPVSEALCDGSLALPMFVGMTPSEVSTVSDTIRAFYRA